MHCGEFTGARRWRGPAVQGHRGEHDLPGSLGAPGWVADMQGRGGWVEGWQIIGFGFRAPPTRPARMRACPCARPPGRPFAPSPACPPAYSPSTMRTKIERHHRANLPSLARACSSAPRTTGPRHGPTLCVPTQIHPCTCSPACPSSLSGSARPSGNEAMLSKTMNVRRRLVKPTRSRQNFALFAGCATPLSSLRPSFRKPVGQIQSVRLSSPDR